MYDIIGDIHGYAKELRALLSLLGYIENNFIYQHPEGRQVIFVGDFIDRGPHIPETLNIVKSMCDAGQAFAIMGNHEYNAICFHTPHVEKGGFFRDHSWKEIKQHTQTLEQFYEREDEWNMYLEWFKSLPLFLEFSHFNVVHAYWNDENIHWIKQHFTTMDSDFLTKSCNKEDESGAFARIEDTLKGIEIELPKGIKNLDKEGKHRNDCRVKWWSPLADRKTMNEVLIPCPKELEQTEIPIGTSYSLYTGTKTVFFGHYSLKHKPSIENPMAICLDYNITHGGLLLACRVDVKDNELLTEFIY